MFFLIKQFYLKYISCLPKWLKITILFNCHHDQDETRSVAILRRVKYYILK